MTHTDLPLAAEVVRLRKINVEMLVVLNDLVVIYQSSLEEHLGRVMANKIRTVIAKAKGDLKC